VTRCFVAVLVFIAALLAPPARANDVSLTGNFVQGGLVVGTAAPGTRVMYDGRERRVGEDGMFLVGFGRDTTTAILELTYPDGRSETRTLEVKPREWLIQRVDGLPQQTVTPDEAQLRRIRAEAELARAARQRDGAEPLFRNGFIWPAQGPISGVYGSQRILNGQPRAPHYGVDIAAPVGTPVVATTDGVVTLAHEDMFLTGKTVILDHGYGLSSVYSHLHEITVREGERVSQGHTIGRVGGTGRATAPHLHWGMNLFDIRLDPALLVPPMKTDQPGGSAR
jgi:murein DD-endopeptidase MepM/ murein hydrolase activator NlpD